MSGKIKRKPPEKDLGSRFLGRGPTKELRQKPANRFFRSRARITAKSFPWTFACRQMLDEVAGIAEIGGRKVSPSESAHTVGRFRSNG